MRAPRILVSLASAQEIKTAGLLANRFRNGVSNQQHAGTEIRHCWIKSRQIIRSAFAAKKSHVNAHQFPVETHSIQPQNFLAKQSGRSEPMQFLDMFIFKHAALAALLPARAMQSKQRV